MVKKKKKLTLIINMLLVNYFYPAGDIVLNSVLKGSVCPKVWLVNNLLRSCGLVSPETDKNKFNFEPTL